MCCGSPSIALRIALRSRFPVTATMPLCGLAEHCNPRPGLAHLCSVTSSTEEFTEFAAGAAARLRRTAFLLCGDWHAAEDLAQATLAKMFVSWRRIRRQDERRDTSGGIGASVSQVGVVT